MNGTLKKTSAIVVGIILSIPLAIFGFFAYQNVSTRASDSAPRDVIIKEVTDSSAQIKWTTDQPTQGVVEYGTSPTALVFFAPEAQKTKDHIVDITLLTPGTTHYFQIRVGEDVYDNAGVPWTFTTKSSRKADGEEGEEELSVIPTRGIRTTVQPSPSEIDEDNSPTEATTSRSTPTQLPKSPTPVAQPVSCDEIEDCQRVLQLLNKGCSTADYVRCIKRAVTPTITPTPTKAQPADEDD